MTFHFAWVEPAETTFGPEHQREDEQVFAFRLEHAEGDFATLSIDIRNPQRQLLAGTDIWAWLSEDGTALFFGRLVAVPEDLHAEIVRLNFVARPSGYEATKRALADTLKVQPYWDPVWIREERLEDPDAVLEARSQLWHIDRVTHDLTVSDIAVGEAGTLAVSDHDYSSLSITYAAPPLRRARVEAEVSWDQVARGALDITSELIGAFGVTGSDEHVISSYTGQGLEADWPEVGDDLDGGWSVGATSLVRGDGVWREPRFRDVRVGGGARLGDAQPGDAAEAFVSAPATARFHLWEFRPRLVLAYEVARPRIERVHFTLAAEVQPVFSEPGDEEEIVVSLGSRRVGEEIGGVLPLGDRRRRAYLRTDRGRRSLEYLVALARAKLLARARAAEIRVVVPFETATGLSCRHSVTITDGRIPGGSASGKVIRYVLRVDGDTGERRGEIRIGCMIGTGTAHTGDPGVPAYVDDGYADPGWQLRAGEMIAAIAGEIAIGDLSGAAVVDDGIDFFQLRPADVILALDVLNGESAQEGALDREFEDIPDAVEALNSAFTEVVLDLKPLTGGPFETDYAPAVTPLAVPRTLTL